MSRFLRIIYVQPLNRILFFIVLLIIVWSTLGYKADKKKWWALFNTVIALCSFSGIMFMTLYSRVPGVYEVILIPFHSFVEAKEQPEIFVFHNSV